MGKLSSEQLKAFALSECKADLAGIASADRFAGAPNGQRPGDFLPGCRSIIVLAVGVPDGALQAIMRKREDGLDSVHGIYGSYGYVGGPNYTLLFGADKMARFIENKTGEIATPCPAGPTHGAKMISLRHAAVAAGLGTFGWHSIVISPEYGTRNRFAAILTTAEFEPDPLYDGPELCNPEKCGVCAGICPNGSIPKYNEGEKVSVEIGEKTYTYCKFRFDPCTVAGQGLFGDGAVAAIAEGRGKPGPPDPKTEPNNSFFIHFTSWKCGFCMAYCPAGGWAKHFPKQGLTRINLKEYMNGAPR
jgi:epoxyqueuosine reductase QueG